MNWKFKLLDKNEHITRYSYSTDTLELDGLIQYELPADEITIIKPCSFDEGRPKAQELSMLKFEKVINDGFPLEVRICCG